MTSQTPLPQEIFDNIIDHCAKDLPTLHILALVTPSWLASVRTHLFARISLDPPKRGVHSSSFNKLFSRKQEPSSCEKLFNLITTSQRIASRLRGIAPYVREVRLCEGMHAREWLAREITLPALLRSFPNLCRFEISCSASVRIAWGQLPEQLRNALKVDVLSSSRLREVRLSSLMLSGLRDMRELLEACRGLRVLEVDHITFADESTECLEGKAEERVEKTPLDVLVIGPRTSNAVVQCLLHESSPVTIATVRRLSISISGNFASFARLLNASTSVENLELVLMNDTNLQEYWNLTPSDQFDLSQAPCLRDLKVSIDVLQKLDDPLPWLSALLHTGIDKSYPTRPNALQNIWIVYALYLPAPYMDRSANTAIFDRWSDIDAILCGADPGMEIEAGKIKAAHAFENLERVKLEFMLENPIGFGVAPRFLKELVLDSPGLEERDVLRINAFDTSG